MNRYEIGWLAIVATAVTYEIWCYATGKPTLTDVTLKYLPSPITMGFLFWLNLHFGLNYAEQPSKQGTWFKNIFGA